MDILDIAKRVFKIEAEAIKHLSDKLNADFEKAVNIILKTSGKIVLTGIGKSGLICKKIASTFASTGTPAFFLHPSEGVHGDLGMLAKNDTLIAMSNSGETDELVKILPLIKRLGIRLIAMTGNKDSTLAKSADVFLDISVKEEACPLGLAPTASTTAALAMGDALAVALLEKRGFKEEDFAMLHPGGSLGRKLLTRVGDLMHTGESIPLVNTETSMKEAIIEMTAKRLGVTGAVDANGRLQGIITDGDLRRALEKVNNILDKKVCDVMTKTPRNIEKGEFAEAAVRKMEENAITTLFVFERGNEDIPVGIIHLHDLLKAGIV
ncbi:MAG: D-arabinose 5-phosphate isomerase [Deltaproteobacteria bacterium GWC2_42_11]|nr:MAG: D-arabinose 5-phosphate isomerase [Deltaproteobacteria bacterium GWC2_42_11]HBO84479.1 D-arabinose 5-phosphate isomerase [Deltaproteobacteria bacterium]